MEGSEMPKVLCSVSRLSAVGWFAATLSNNRDEGVKPSFFICSNTGRLSCRTACVNRSSGVRYCSIRAVCS